MKYETLIFDADDTLYDFHKAEEYAFKKALNEVGLEYTPALMSTYKEVNLKIWKELEKGLITQEKLKYERFNRFFKAVNLKGDTLKIADSFLDNLASAGFLYEGAEELIESLSKQYRLVIVTNGLKRVQTKRIKNHSIAKYFEKVIISDEIGYKKPDPMIFIEGLKDLKPINKDKTIIIGDSLTSDIQGGKNFGIDTCWCNFSKKENQTNIKPTYVIENLSDINKIL